MEQAGSVATAGVNPETIRSPMKVDDSKYPTFLGGL